MPPRSTRRSRSRPSERVEEEHTDNTTTDVQEEDLDIDIDALVNQAAHRLTELSAEDQESTTVDTSSLNSVDKSIAKTLGLDGKSSAVYNPTTRFLVPQADGMIRLDQTQLNQTAATSSSVFLRAGVLSSTAADPIEKIDKETDLVADLVAEKDAAWKKKSEPPVRLFVLHRIFFLSRCIIFISHIFPIYLSLFRRRRLLERVGSIFPHQNSPMKLKMISACLETVMLCIRIASTRERRVTCSLDTSKSVLLWRARRMCLPLAALTIETERAQFWKKFLLIRKPHHICAKSSMKCSLSHRRSAHLQASMLPIRSSEDKHKSIQDSRWSRCTDMRMCSAFVL